MKCFFALLLTAGLGCRAAGAQAQPAAPAATVYAVVEEMPRFKSADPGTQAMMEYLGSTTRYPAEALIAQATGRVYVSFVVNAEGAVEQAKIVKGRHRALDQEALRVVSAMPRWEVPGRLQGHPVSVAITVPISFNMRDATPKESREIMAAQRQGAVKKRLNEAQGQLSQPNAPGLDSGPVFLADPLGVTNYLNRQVQYPLDAVRARQQGAVLVSFNVTAEGLVTDARVTHGLFPSLDAEALRVVTGMPKWQPGARAGRPAGTPMNDVPVTFRLK